MEKFQSFVTDQQTPPNPTLHSCGADHWDDCAVKH